MAPDLSPEPGGSAQAAIEMATERSVTTRLRERTHRPIAQTPLLVCWGKILWLSRVETTRVAPARAGWISILLLEWLLTQCDHPAHRWPGRSPRPAHSRAQLRLPRSRVDQHVAIGMATERSATTRPKDAPRLPRPLVAAVVAITPPRQDSMCRSAACLSRVVHCATKEMMQPCLINLHVSLVPLRACYRRAACSGTLPLEWLWKAVQNHPAQRTRLRPRRRERREVRRELVRTPGAAALRHPFSPRAGGVSMLLLESLRKAVRPFGSRALPCGKLAVPTTMPGNHRRDCHFADTPPLHPIKTPTKARERSKMTELSPTASCLGWRRKP